MHNTLGFHLRLAASPIPRCFLLPVDGIKRKLTDVITDASYAILFFAFWRRDVERASNTTATLKLNFITAQTYQDVLLSLMMLVCAIKLFRLKFPGLLFQPSRFSSRFAEYVFQMLRSATKTSNKVNAQQSLHIIREALHVLMCEADGSLMDLPTVEHKRGGETCGGRGC